MTSRVEDIWHEFAARLRGFIRSRVRDHAAAEDILQDVFLKIQRRLPTLRAGERVESWVWRITRNAIIDHVRRQRADEPLAADARAPEAELQTGMPDLTPCVRRFVGELAPTYREALVLTEWQGLTQREMAKQLGLSLSGAKSRVQRARGQLKGLLQQCCRLELDRRGNVVEMQPRRTRCDPAC